MVSRLDDIPVYEQTQIRLAAADYNQVQLALKRMGGALRIPLAGLRSLELVVDREAWIVIDRDLNEIPVLAWTDFQVQGRNTLHEPIACVLKSYHAHGGEIVDKVMALMRQELAQRLVDQSGVAGGRVTPLKKD